MAIEVLRVYERNMRRINSGRGSDLAIFDVLLDVYYTFGILYTNNLGTRRRLTLPSTMDGLNDDQRYALSQLRELTNGGDDDAAINILESVGWNVQVRPKKPCIDLTLTHHRLMIL